MPPTFCAACIPSYLIIESDSAIINRMLAAGQGTSVVPGEAAPGEVAPGEASPGEAAPGEAAKPSELSPVREGTSKIKREI